MDPRNGDILYGFKAKILILIPLETCPQVKEPDMWDGTTNKDIEETSRDCLEK